MINPNLKLALDYIKSHDLTLLANGRHEIDGDNVFVNIVDADLRPCTEAKYEVHNSYIDVHVPLSGPESFGAKPRHSCTAPIGTFNADEDFLLYQDSVVLTDTVQPGEYIVFAPDTAHAPLIGDGRIHKAIFKVRMV